MQYSGWRGVLSVPRCYDGSSIQRVCRSRGDVMIRFGCSEVKDRAKLCALLGGWEPCLP